MKFKKGDKVKLYRYLVNEHFITNEEDIGGAFFNYSKNDLYGIIRRLGESDSNELIKRVYKVDWFTIKEDKNVYNNSTYYETELKPFLKNSNIKFVEEK